MVTTIQIVENVNRCFHLSENQVPHETFFFGFSKDDETREVCLINAYLTLDELVEQRIREGYKVTIKPREIVN
jgi:hypothetical protein